MMSLDLLKLDSRVLGNYRLEALVDRGGLALIYNAIDLRSQQKVAVKILSSLEDERITERLLNELRLSASLQHPHMLPVYEVGEEPGFIYLATRLLMGGSLRQRLPYDARLPISESLTILTQIASALSHAHENGLVHRNITPACILFDSEGSAYVSEFGFSAAYLIDGESNTKISGLAGRPTYISPEQGQQTPGDHRMDIFSLGVVAYEMLSGHPPFDAEMPLGIIQKLLNESPPKLATPDSAFSAAVDVVFARVLAKDADDRYASAAAFVADLADAVNVAPRIQ